MSVHPDLIQQFCIQAIENGVLDATFKQARADLFIEWEDAEDTQKRDLIWSKLWGLQKAYGILRGYSEYAPDVD